MVNIFSPQKSLERKRGWGGSGEFYMNESFPYSLTDSALLVTEVYRIEACPALALQDLLFVCQIPLDLKKKVLQNFKQRKLI